MASPVQVHPDAEAVHEITINECIESNDESTDSVPYDAVLSSVSRASRCVEANSIDSSTETAREESRKEP